MQDEELIRAVQVAAVRAMFFVDALEGIAHIMLALDQHQALEAVEDLSVWWAIHGVTMITFLHASGIEAVPVSAFDVLSPDAALLRTPVAGHA